MNSNFHHRYAPVPLLMAAAVFIFAAPLFWIGVEASGSGRSDHLAENTGLFQEVLPGLQYGFGRLSRGDFPLWNDRQLCGTPCFADPRHALLQPLNSVFLFFDLPRAMALHAFLSLSLMGFFFVLFMRSMNLRYIPALLGGMAYTCCGGTAAAMSLPAVVSVLVWLPLLCCLIRETMMRPRPFLTIAGCLVTACLMLSGAPLLIFTALVTAFGYGLAAFLLGIPSTKQAETKEGGTWQRLGSLAVMLLLGTLLSSIQWIPTWAWLLGLNAPWNFLLRMDIAGEAPHGLRGLLAQLLESHAALLPALAYLGVCSLLIIPAAFFHGIPKWERGFLGTVALGSLLVVAGMPGNTPVSGAFSVLIYPASFAGAALVALGADRLFAARRDPLTPRLWGPLLLVSVLFLFLFILAPDSTRGRMLPVAGAVLFFAVFRTRWAGGVSGMLLLLFLFIDLNTSIVNHQVHPFFAQDGKIPLDARLGGLLRETALADRLLVSTHPNNNRLHANMGMGAGFRMAGGTGIPLTPEQQRWWNALAAEETGTGSGKQGEYSASAARDVSAQSPHIPLLNVMSVRAVATTDGGGLGEKTPVGVRLRRRGDDGDIIVYANENVMPRLSWVPSWQVTLDIRAAIEAICAPDFDCQKECVIVPEDAAISHLVGIMPERRPPPAGTPQEQGVPAEMRFMEDDPERLSVEVNSLIPGILVLTDTYDKGWRAFVDNRPVPMLRANGLFRGIALPEGKHLVEFRYRPRSLYAGIGMSSLALLLLILYGVMTSRRQNRAR